MNYPAYLRKRRKALPMLTNRRIKKIFLNVAGLFILVVAIILRVSQLYLMAAILLLIPLVSYSLGRALMWGLACERRLPASCSEGERILVTLLVTNTGLLPKVGLRVRDRLPRWLEAVGPEALPITQLLPGEAGTATYTLEPRKRGVYTFGAAQIVSTDPLGFYGFVQDVPAAGELVVYPSLLPLSRATAEGGGAFGPREQDGTLARGGIDFDGVREWRPGDELRRVHWRTTARTGKLAVVEYAQGTASELSLALDLNNSAYAGTGDGPDGALETAIRMAASLALCFLREGWTVRFLAPGADAPLVLTEPAQGPRLLEMLARANADAPQTLADVLGAVQAAGAGGGSLLYVTPDAHSPALAAAIAAWGGRVQGWGLDRESFLPAPAGRKGRATPGATSVFAPAPLMTGSALGTVRRGDDVTAVLESGSNARR